MIDVGNDARLVALVLRLPRATKRAIVLAVDAVLCIASVWLAFYLRIGQWPFPPPLDPTAPVLAAIALSLPLFVRFGLYRAIFRYAGFSAMAAITTAVAIYAVPYSALFTFWGLPGVPRTIGLLQPLLLLLLIGASRAIAAAWLGERYMAQRRRSGMPKVIIFGAGSAGRQLASAIRSSAEMHLVGFADDDPSLRRSMLAGTEIFGREDLRRLVEERGVTDVLLAIPSSTRARRLSLVTLLLDLGVHVRTLPAMADIARGRISVGDLRELEIEDLLGRAAVPPDVALMQRNIAGQVVMVTGAGGSIGRELCRQILRVRPATLLMVDAAEFALYDVDRELTAICRADDIATVLAPLIGSVGDAGRMAAIIAAWSPATIFHAAAYKHVPLVEQNIVEGVRNNVIGTRTLARAAREGGVASFVLISTDKAVRPTNVMGATKRLAELVLQAMAAEDAGPTCFAMVRFGNVLGSSGSVVPLFREQIAAGGPVTITHQDITRYFMLIPEAAQLVIQAGAMAEGGDVFVLDMGEPVRIVDLARNMIELSGLRVRDAADPDGDIEIAVSGLRPGEKLFEELLTGDNPELSSHPRIMRAREGFLPATELDALLERLDDMIARGDAAACRALLREAVGDFKPSSDIVDLIDANQDAG